MNYYTSIIIITFMGLAILCILTYENDRIQKEEKNLLYLTYAVIAAAAMFEWIGVQLNGKPGTPRWLLLAVKCCDYIFTPIAGGFLVFRLKIRDRERQILIGLLALNSVFQIISCFTGWMVTIDENNHYSHGPLYIVYTIIYLLIIALVIIEFKAYGERFDNKNLASLYGIQILVFTGIGIQETSSGDIRLSYLSLAFGAALLFIRHTEFSQLDTDRLMMTDELTGLLNRFAYRKDLKEIDEAGKLPGNLAVFMIDINDLKGVNDSLGHDAGDELIRGASVCISETFNFTQKCYRIGGDEFVVLAEIGKELAGNIMELLNRKAETWKGELVGEMSLACGYAHVSNHEYDSVEQVIKDADQAMYEAKYDYYLHSGKDRRKFYRR